MGWLSGWQYRREVEIQTAYVDNDLYNFPLYVPITPSGVGQGMASKCKDGGADLRFTEGDGETLLKYEIEYFLKSDGNVTARLWVKVPTVSSDPDSPTKIYLYYGNAEAADAQDPQGTWDNNFAAVYHFGDGSTLSLTDSSGNRNLTNYGCQAIAGKVGGAKTIPSAGKYASASAANVSYLTVGGWIRINGYGWRRFVCNNGTVWPAWWLQARGDDGRMEIGLHNGSGDVVLGGGNVPNNVWTHIVGTCDGTTMRLYQNGAQVNSRGQPWPVPTHANSLDFGRVVWGGVFYYNVNDSDEVRVSSTARSAAWIKFEYRNQSESDNELTWSDEEQSGPPPTTRIPWHLFFAGMSC